MPVIFRDDFTSTISANWAKTDTTAKLSAAGGYLVVAGGLGSPVWTDPKLRYPNATTLSRATLGGMAVLARFSNNGGQGPAVAFHPTAAVTTPNTAGVVFNYPDLYAFGVQVSPLGTRMRSIDYLLTLIPRAGGGFWAFASVPNQSGSPQYATWPNGTLLYMTDTTADANIYAHLANHSAFWYADYATILDSAELTTPFTSRLGIADGADDFNSGTTLTGRSTPVGTKAWTVTGGTASISGGSASLPTGVTALAPMTAAPRIIEAYVTRTGSPGSRPVVCFRGSDTNYANCWRFKGEFDRVSLHEGATFRTQTGAISLTAGTQYRLTVMDYGDRIECLVDGVSWLQWNSTSGAANTYCGISSEAATSTFNEFAAYQSSVALPGNFGTPPEVPAGQGTALSTDAFTGADGTALATYNAAWTAHSGTWQINTNRARMSATGNGIATRSTGLAAADHAVEADITTPNTTPDYSVGGTDWYCGLFARYTDASNYVHARFLFQGNGAGVGSPEVELWEKNAGVATLIGYINLGTGNLLQNTTRNLRLAVKGNQAAAFLDGECVVQAITTVATGSRAGMGVDDSGTKSGQPAWDNLLIKATTALDTTAPAITVAPAASGITSAAATITWTTDEASDSQVEYGTTTGYGASTTLNTSLVTSHSQGLSGLTANTLYHYRVKSRDAAGNLLTTGDFTFTTLSAGGAAPVISAVTTSNVTSSGFTVTWTTDIPSDSQVEYGTSPALGSATTLNPALVTSHSVPVSGLLSNTVYHYRVRSAAP